MTGKNPFFAGIGFTWFGFHLRCAISLRLSCHQLHEHLLEAREVNIHLRSAASGVHPYKHRKTIVTIDGGSYDFAIRFRGRRRYPPWLLVKLRTQLRTQLSTHPCLIESRRPAW
jgi:hypothetical protein